MRSMSGGNVCGCVECIMHPKRTSMISEKERAKNRHENMRGKALCLDAPVSGCRIMCGGNQQKSSRDGWKQTLWGYEKPSLWNMLSSVLKATGFTRLQNRNVE